MNDAEDRLRRIVRVIETRYVRAKTVRGIWIVHEIANGKNPADEHDPRRGKPKRKPRSKRNGKTVVVSSAYMLKRFGVRS